MKHVPLPLPCHHKMVTDDLYVGGTRNEISLMIKQHDTELETGTARAFDTTILNSMASRMCSLWAWRAAAAGARLRGERRSGGGSIAWAPLTRAV